jgi:PPOX class probable F420-dependent enzyme
MADPEKVEAFLAEPRNAIVAGVRKDGSPHVTPNWFYWDGERFYVSITRTRAKYRIFKRDPRVELVVDDSTAFRCVLVPGRAEIHEDLAAELPRFRALRNKHGRPQPPDDELLAALAKEERVLLVITPTAPLRDWRAWGLD